MESRGAPRTAHRILRTTPAITTLTFKMVNTMIQYGVDIYYRMSIAKYIICIPANSLMYFSQLYSPGKSSRIGWWRGICKEDPPHHYRCLALTSMVPPIPLSATGPKFTKRHRQPGGGGRGLRFTHTSYIATCTALLQRLVSAWEYCAPMYDFRGKTREIA